MIGLFYLALGASSGRLRDPGDSATSQLLLAFPISTFLLLSIIAGFGGFLAVTYGAAVSGAEWAWGTIRSVIARGEGRVRYILVKFAAVAVMVTVGVVVAFVIGMVLAVAAASLAHVPVTGLLETGELLRMGELVARASFAVIEQAAVGFAIASLFKSQLAGIGAGLAIYFGQLFLAIVPALRDVIPYLPFQAAGSVVTSAAGFTTELGGRGGASAAGLDSTTAILFTAGWLLVALAIAAAATQRAEITA
jgi:ABC-2 type transport system permease protein